MKYIILRNAYKQELPWVFDENFTHKEYFEKVKKENPLDILKPISAGICEYKNGLLSFGGESATLHLESHHEDGELLEKFFKDSNFLLKEIAAQNYIKSYE